MIKANLAKLTAIGLIGFTVFAVGLVVNVPGTSAQGEALQACDELNANNAICRERGSNVLPQRMTNVINVLLTVAGFIAVILIIIGGLRYVLSGGDSAGINSAKNTILYASVGLVVAILAYAIVNFVLGWFT